MMQICAELGLAIVTGSNLFFVWSLSSERNINLYSKKKERTIRHRPERSAAAAAASRTPHHFYASIIQGESAKIFQMVLTDSSCIKAITEQEDIKHPNSAGFALSFYLNT